MKQGGMVAQAGRPRQEADKWVRGWPVQEETPLVARQAPEVKTIYQKKCKKCPWVSISSMNLNAYKGAVAELWPLCCSVPLSDSTFQLHCPTPLFFLLLCGQIIQLLFCKCPTLDVTYL